ncbi:trypsin-like peptidase domain-containing protein [Halobellus sp. GM3]|uniref:trypsin-like peptidase domain-containing protein n=1 Tax=Halobellus sp. GM3 TaxID=3458410 RepID=UPI00403DF7A4
MSKMMTRRKWMSVTGLGALGILGGCAGMSSQDESSTAGTQDEVVQHDHQDGSSDFSDETLTRAGDLGETVQQSVVKLTKGNSGGTGWVIEDGYIITNSHVTRDFETMDIETFDGRSATATRVGYHEDMIPDIALMKTNMETPSPLPMKTNTGVSKGDPVLSVGHPGDVGDWVISLGRYQRYEEGINWELSDIPTSPGNSGSPIVTLDGVVFGCISGTTKTGGESSSVDRPEKVYTEFPRQESLATANPSKTIEKWVQEWK